MKVICDRAALLDAVNLVSGVVASRSPKPQLTCIKLEASKGGSDGAGRLTLSGTDGEVSLRLSTSNVEVQKEGAFLVPADKIKQIASAETDPTLTLSTKDDSCVITASHSKFTVFGPPASDFPPIPEFPADDSGADIFGLSADTLGTLITRTVFSTARENSRYAINGVLLKRAGKKIEMVATDGRRLAFARGGSETSGGEGSSCIVPTKALTVAGRLINDPAANVRVAVTANQIVIAFSGGEDSPETVLTSRLVEGTFPPYEDVIPKDQDKKATFDVDLLASAVRRASLLTNEESRGVRMHFDKGSSTLTLRSRAPESGEAEIDVSIAGYEGDDIEIGFNPQFITEALKIIPDKQIVIEMKSPNKPGLIKAGPDFMYVVMPVNLQ